MSGKLLKEAEQTPRKILNFGEAATAHEQSPSHPAVGDKAPTVVTQSPITPPLVTQSPSHPVTQRTEEAVYPSRAKKVKLGPRLPAEKVEFYKIWCIKNKKDIQEAIEAGLDWVTGWQGSQSPTLINNDLNNDSKLLRVSDLYKNLTKRKDFNARDREAYNEIRHHDEEFIIAIMAATHARKKPHQPINGFRYFTTAIQNAAVGRVVPQTPATRPPDTKNDASTGQQMTPEQTMRAVELMEQGMSADEAAAMVEREG